MDTHRSNDTTHHRPETCPTERCGDRRNAQQVERPASQKDRHDRHGQDDHDSYDRTERCGPDNFGAEQRVRTRMGHWKPSILAGG